MLKRKIITVMIMVVLALTSGAAWGTTYYVDPSGDDGANGLSWATAFATIKKGITSANGGTPSSYDVIDVNSGTYVTGPIKLWDCDGNRHLVFEPNVTVQARSIFDPDDPNDPDSTSSFRNPSACLFWLRNTNNIIFDGNDTTFEMRRYEYPPNVVFDANSDVNLVSDEITIEEHGYRVGDKLQYYSRGNPPVSPLEPWADPNRHYYYVIIVDTKTIKLAYSFDDAEDGNAIDLETKPASSTKPHVLAGGEQRHGILLCGCSNIEIRDIICKDCGGDGICIAGGNIIRYSEGVSVENVTCDNNFRQGISITSVDGLTIDDCIFKNSDNSNIRIEPSGGDANTGVLTNIVVRDTICKDGGSDAGDLCLTLNNFTSDNKDVDMVFENLLVSGGASGIRVLSYANGLGGSIKFKSVTVENTADNGTSIYKTINDFDLSFENCVWRNIDPNDSSWIIRICYIGGCPGGVDFNGCQVFDDINRPAIIFTGDEDDTLYEVHGNLYVKNDNRIPDDPDDPDDPNCLYDWNGADTNNVDINVQWGFCKVFTVKNDSGEPVAYFNYGGELFLKGTLDVDSTHSATGNDEFRFQDSGGNDVAIIDADDGNMYIDGSLFEDQNSLTPSANSDDFIIKNSDGNDVAYVAYIDESGNMYLKGKLYEDPNL